MVTTEIDLKKLKAAIKEDLAEIEVYPEKFDFRTLSIEGNEGKIQYINKRVVYNKLIQYEIAEHLQETALQGAIKGFKEAGLNNDLSNYTHKIEYLTVYSQDQDDVVNYDWVYGTNFYEEKIMKGSVTSTLQFIIDMDKAQCRIRDFVIPEPPSLDEIAEYNHLIRVRSIISNMLMEEFRRAIGNHLNFGEDGSYEISNSASSRSYSVKYPTKYESFEDIDRIIDQHLSHLK